MGRGTFYDARDRSTRTCHEWGSRAIPVAENTGGAAGSRSSENRNNRGEGDNSYTYPSFHYDEAESNRRFFAVGRCELALATGERYEQEYDTAGQLLSSRRVVVSREGDGNGTQTRGFNEARRTNVLTKGRGRWLRGLGFVHGEADGDGSNTNSGTSDEHESTLVSTSTTTSVSGSSSSGVSAGNGKEKIPPVRPWVRLMLDQTTDNSSSASSRGWLNVP